MTKDYIDYDVPDKMISKGYRLTSFCYDKKNHKIYERYEHQKKKRIMRLISGLVH